ncbi:MAG: SAM-dependent methyltransferase [Acidobacteria bacterium]|nr:SAM-dependent methyltransferase [Acidobacteriota bacterium]
MEKETRNRIQNATQAVRRLLEQEYSEQLEGTFAILRNGTIAADAGGQLTDAQRLVREKIVAAIRHKEAGGMMAAEAVADFIRDAAFTTLNRFAALKMLEARELVRECVSRGEESAGYKEFHGLATPLAILPEQQGYHLYLESIFDEISVEVKILFDRRDVASLLWPRRAALASLLHVVNRSDLATVWSEDETIGWFYQFFNSREEREQMRDVKRGGSAVPRNSRELAVRNQFFTPRYVVEFLVDNTLGRTWTEMMDTTRLQERCRFYVKPLGDDERRPARPKKDPRDLKILDPACGSGHFLLYAFDLLLVMYEEAWIDVDAPSSEVTGRPLRDDYGTTEELRAAVPGMILRHNLHGVDIDPRAAQIAALALWMRAQRAYFALGLSRDARPVIEKTNIVIAEPMPGERAMRDELIASLDPQMARVAAGVFDRMRLAGDLGVLLRMEQEIQYEMRAVYKDFGSLFAEQEAGKWADVEERLCAALRAYGEHAEGNDAYARRLFADDAARGLALMDICGRRYDVVLMNPPFGAGSARAKKDFEAAYARTKNNIYAAFVERGVELLHPRGFLGAITSRTGFFLPSFQKFREEVVLQEAPPVVVVDLGYGVLDDAMVEVAAYCLERAT